MRLCKDNRVLLGTARRSITPRRPVPLCPPQAHAVAETYDDLMVRALYLRQDRHQWLLISLDLLGLGPGLVQWLRSRIGEALDLGPHEITLSAVHTHNGPATGGPGVPLLELGADGDYLAWLVDQVLGTALQARGTLMPATAHYMQGRCGISVSRRKRQADGTIRVAPNPLGPNDQSVDVVSFRDAERIIKAVVAVYACHPVAAASVDQIGGDYMGFAASAVQRWLPDHPQVQILQSCCGDIHLNWIGRDGGFGFGEQGVEAAQLFGRQLASVVVALVEAGGRPIRPILSLGSAKAALPYRQTPPREELEAAALQTRTDHYVETVERLWARKYLDLIRGGGALPIGCPCDVQAVRLGTNLAMVFMGGEVCNGIGRRIRSESPFQHTIPVAYANSIEPGYVPTRRIVREGSFEAGTGFEHGGDTVTKEYGLLAQYAETAEDVVCQCAGRLLEQLSQQPSEADHG